jgi:hypothetical protein
MRVFKINYEVERKIHWKMQTNISLLLISSTFNKLSACRKQEEYMLNVIRFDSVRRERNNFCYFHMHWEDRCILFCGQSLKLYIHLLPPYRFSGVIVKLGKYQKIRPVFLINRWFNYIGLWLHESNFPTPQLEGAKLKLSCACRCMQTEEAVWCTELEPKCDSLTFSN